MRRTHRVGLAVALLLLITGLDGCAGRVAKKILAQQDDGTFTSPLYGRYVLVHADGYGIDKNFRPMSDLEARRWRWTILERLDRTVTSLRDGNNCVPGAGGHQTLRVLVFVHGGLNSYDDGAEKMAAYLTATPPASYAEPPKGPAPTDILRTACIAPVFISWNSEAFSSLYDDLVDLRNGERPTTGIGHVMRWATAPFVLVSRLASALGNLPVAVGHGLERTFRGARSAIDETRDSRAETLADVAAHAPWGLAHLVTTPMLEGLGTPTWAIMKRRAELAVAARLPSRVPSEMWLPFRGDNESSSCIDQIRWQGEPIPNGKTVARHEASGMAAALFRELGLYLSCRRGQFLDGQPGAVDVTVTLVGHSMGSMLLDRLVALYGDLLPIRDIVYLAPAASIDDVAHNVLAYLYRRELRHVEALHLFRRQREAFEVELAKQLDGSLLPHVRKILDAQEQRFCERLGHDAMPHLWVFTLNARDEAREISRWPLIVVPRGSLLEWIDGYFQPNKTTGERTSGREDNVNQYEGSVHQLVPLLQGPCTDTWITLQSLQNPDDPNTPRSAEFPGGGFVSVPMHLPGIDDWRIHIFRASRKHGDNTVPEEHGDFAAPRFLGQVLCGVDRTLFPPGFCFSGISSDDAIARPGPIMNYWPRLHTEYGE